MTHPVDHGAARYAMLRYGLSMIDAKTHHNRQRHALRLLSIEAKRRERERMLQAREALALRFREAGLI